MEAKAKLECSRCGLCIDKVPMFEGLDVHEQQRILSRADHEIVPKNTVLFQAWDRMDKMIIVRQGKVKLSNFDENGKEYIYGIITDGGIVGEESIFSKTSFGMYGETLCESHICVLTEEIIETLIRKDAEFAVKFIRILGEKFVREREELKLLLIDDTKERLKKYLVLRSEQIQKREIELSRDTIAAATHISRETVSRKLNELAREDVIELVGYKRIKIKNIDKLRLV